MNEFVDKVAKAMLFAAEVYGIICLISGALLCILAPELFEDTKCNDLD